MTTSWPADRPTQTELADREHAITALYDTDAERLAAIHADRRERFTAIVAQFALPTPFRNWAAAMTMRYGPACLVWGQQYDWIIALLIARYGEAEYFWPDALTQEDWERASHWWDGDTPNGVRYIPTPAEAAFMPATPPSTATLGG